MSTKTSKKEKTDDTDSSGDASEKRNKPIRTFRVEEIYVSVWSNQHELDGEMRTFYSYSLERAYRNQFGNTGYSKSFQLGSRARIDKAIGQAEEYLQTLVHPESMLPSEEATLTV